MSRDFPDKVVCFQPVVFPFASRASNRFFASRYSGLVSKVVLPFVWIPFESPLTYTIGYTLLAVGSAGLILAAWFASNPAPGMTLVASSGGVFQRAVALVAKVGTFSYSIYLWHMPFAMPRVMWIRAHIGMWGSPYEYPVAVIMYVAVTIGLGAVMFYLIERPSLMLRERLFPSRSFSPRGIAVTVDHVGKELHHSISNSITAEATLSKIPA